MNQMVKCNIFNQNGSVFSRQRVVSWSWSVTFSWGIPQSQDSSDWQKWRFFLGPENDEYPGGGVAVVFRGVDRPCDFLKQTEHNKQLPGHTTHTFELRLPETCRKSIRKFSTKKSPAAPLSLRHQRHQALRCIFSSGIAADVGNLPRNTGFFWRTLDGWKFSFENQNSWQLWMFFSIEKCEKKVNLGKKSCVANKNL